MIFKVTPVDTNVKNEQGGYVYLVEDNWNDWWKYRVLYQMYFKDEQDEVFYIGSVKFGEIGMKEGQDKVNIPKQFESLNNTKLFSLGQDSYYYENLNRLGDQFRDQLLQNLKDISLDLNLLSKVVSLNVTSDAVMRGINIETIKKKYNHLASGNSALTEYDLEFIIPKSENELSERYELPFVSEPDSNPPTNVQAIIGRNGVGKTYLLNQMVGSLIGSEKERENFGEFHSSIVPKNEQIFDNIIYLSFSAFDDAKFFEPKKIKKNGIGYTYIGLKTRAISSKNIKRKKADSLKNTVRTKSTEQLRNEFIESVWTCRAIPSKKARLEQAINMLYTDPIFANSQVADLLMATEEERQYEKKADLEKRELTENEKKYLKDSFIETSEPICKKFSSGHSIVLLTIVKLIQELEEKTLVLLDEPESHLHPPLLSTFTRILSNLLVSRNGMGIIATHSPVILQEIPKKCVWILNRFGREFQFDRPEIETFGENINTLTKEVFSFEITDSGFHKLLHEVANKMESYEDALKYFNNELGMEARAILRALMQQRENG
ncbi:AAA family ATPase [Sporosarcina sp. 179-K 3D1 HS]|uniref:AAA family ATPase n=1 Tax=Sporosarcina sp. 179-K 3D1 HS TaxID=3232169 RepID=UPI0039A38228